MLHRKQALANVPDKKLLNICQSPGIDPGLVFQMASRQLLHRPFFRRPDLVTLIVALSPAVMMNLIDYMRYFVMTMLILPLVMTAVTSLWTYFGARRLLRLGTLFHLVNTPLHLPSIVDDYERHFRLTAAQSILLLIVVWCAFSILVLFVLQAVDEILLLLLVLAYFIFIWQLVCPAVSQIAFYTALDGTSFFSHFIHSRALSALVVLFFLFLPIAALLGVLYLTVRMPDMDFVLNIFLVLIWPYLLFLIVAIPGCIHWIRTRIPRLTEGDRQSRLMHRIVSLSYS